MRFLWLRIAVLLVVCSLLPTSFAAAFDDLPTAEERKAAAELFTRYCQECHGKEKPKGEVSVVRLVARETSDDDRPAWEKIARQLLDSSMPPADRPQPTAEERAALLVWCGRMTPPVDCAEPQSPGRPTLRRLNRFEYDNTIRDLLGVDTHPAEDFPSDDVGEGFDNIGDVLSLPPLLLEKYLAAAEDVVGKALKLEGPNRVPLNLPGNERLTEVQRRFTTAYEVISTIDLPEQGNYLVQVLAFGEQAGPEVARMSFSLDREPITALDVPATDADPQTYQVWIKATAGRHLLGVGFANDHYNAKDPLPNDRNLVIGQLKVTGPHSELLKSIVKEPPPEAREAQARDAIWRFMARTYRRPPQQDEVDRAMKLFREAERDSTSFAESIGIAWQAILVSPNFLYRVEEESGPSAAYAKAHAISDWELATRLSYFLWSSMPDDELFAEAEQGTLRQQDHLRRQVRRMLADDKSRALAERFATQWLALGNLSTIMPAKELFPAFDEPLRQASQRETELFFTTILREDRSVLEFLDADYTLVNERLARHYGIRGVNGDEFRRVSVNRNERGGLLTQASVLLATSNPSRTSPVKRGRWILDSLLGTPPPPPPPEVPALENGREPLRAATLRERLAEHRTHAECAVCHNGMDPLGLGLENFDATGAWRTKDGGVAIDASGVLPSGESFAGVAQLKELLLSRKRDFGRALAAKMLTYALGRGLVTTDGCVVDELAGALEASDYRFSGLIMAIVESQPFQSKTGVAKP